VFVINAACDGFLSLPLMYLINDVQQIRCFHTHMRPSKSRSCSANALGLYSVRCSVWISAGLLAILTDVFYGSSQSSQENSGIVPGIGHDCFISDSFQFIVYESFSHSTLRGLRYWQHHKVNHTHLKAPIETNRTQLTQENSTLFFITWRRIVI
jgi:hypothetical protein